MHALIAMHSHPFPARVKRLLPLLVLLLPLTAARADDDRLNGNWSLDPGGSESYDSATRRVDDQIAAQRKRRREGRFNMDSLTRASDRLDGRGPTAGSHTRGGNINWSLTDELSAMLEGKTVKIYQSRMCAVLYDKSVKRLFPINTIGKSYSLKGNGAVQDTLGETVSWFEGKRLVVDTDIKGGDRLIEHFTVSEDGKELTLLAKLRRSDLARTIEFKRVFRRD